MAALEKIRDIARIESASCPSTSFENHAEKICSPLGREGLPSFHQTSVRWPRKAETEAVDLVGSNFRLSTKETQIAYIAGLKAE